jgi:membrane fusion protein, multidrug efflux system
MGKFDRLTRRGMWFAAAAVAASLAGAAAVVVRAAQDHPHAVLAVSPASTNETLDVAGAPVVARSGHYSTAYEGVVEAVHQTVVAAPVPGAVVALQVHAGDKVQAGQVLMRIDARAAEQGALAGAAQARAAHAATEEATRDFERQQQLFAEGFISQAALERAQAHLKTAQAGTAAQLASAGAARTQSDLHVVRAPYAGVVGKVSVVLGDMAMPGRPLVMPYDPTALRVTAAIPQGAAATLNPAMTLQVEIPGATGGRIKPVRAQWLPMVDAASHTLELRLELPPDARAAPGMFARAWLPGSEAPGAMERPRLFVPSQALVRRAELVSVYVIGRDGKPALRQVRPGHSVSGEVEILSGVAAGERVALDPQAAARVR